MDSIQIPDKTYFKIGEVAKLLELEPYVLRYWETEFDSLKPEKTRSGQRSYRKIDIEHLVLIKTLLYDEMYTIAGARRQLKLRKKGKGEPLDAESAARLSRERDELLGERDRLQEELRRLESGSDALRQETRRLRVQSESLEDENAQLAAAQVDYESSLSRLRDEMEQKVRELELLDGENAKLMTQLEEVTARAADLTHEVASGDAVERTALAEIQAKLDDANKQLAALTQERDLLLLRPAQADLDEVSGRVERAEEELTQLRTALDEARAAAADTTAQVELEGRVQSLTGALEQAQDELRAAASAREALTFENATLRETAGKLEEQLMAAADPQQLEALEQRLASAQAKVDRLQVERDSLLEDSLHRNQRQRQRFVTLRQQIEGLAAMVN